jgi:predicted CopG family antitoxin
MATKTISLKLEAYEKLKGARRYKGESFSEVVLRASWPDETLTAGELLRICRQRGPLLSSEELERIEQLKQADKAPEDKWISR